MYSFYINEYNRLYFFDSTNQTSDKEDGETTTLFKLVIGKKPSVSHLRVLFSPCIVQKATVRVDKKGVKYVSPSAKEFYQYLCWDSTTSKILSFVCIKYKEDYIFI